MIPTKILELRIARYERIKQGGRFRFVLFYGILGFGLTMGISFSVIELIFPKTLARPVFVFIPVMIAAGMVAGAIWGMVMWPFMMWSYSRALKARDRLSDPSRAE